MHIFHTKYLNLIFEKRNLEMVYIKKWIFINKSSKYFGIRIWKNLIEFLMEKKKRENKGLNLFGKKNRPKIHFIPRN